MNIDRCLQFINLLLLLCYLNFFDANILYKFQVRLRNVCAHKMRFRFRFRQLSFEMTEYLDRMPEKDFSKWKTHLSYWLFILWVFFAHFPNINSLDFFMKAVISLLRKVFILFNKTKTALIPITCRVDITSKNSFALFVFSPPLSPRRELLGILSWSVAPILQMCVS